MLVDWWAAIRSALIIFAILVMAGFIINSVHAATFNLTAQNVTDRTIYWTFDNDSYNIALDGGTPFAFVGSGYIYTNLYPNTMHMIWIENISNETSDIQTTQKDFWDTDYFIFLVFTLFFGLISFRWGWFAIAAMVTAIASIYSAWALGLNDWYTLMAGFALVGIIWRLGSIR